MSEARGEYGTGDSGWYSAYIRPGPEHDGEETVEVYIDGAAGPYTGLMLPVNAAEALWQALGQWHDAQKPHAGEEDAGERIARLFCDARS